MAVIQGDSAYSTKAELISGVWRSFSAVQLLPVLSAGLGCSFGQDGENGGFYCLFPVAPSLLSPFPLVSHTPAASPYCLSPSLLWATVPRLRLSLPLLIWGGFSLASAGRVSSAAPLALALFPLPSLLSLFSLLRVSAAGSAVLCPCLASAVCLLAVAVCPSLCLAVMISTACALCHLSVLPPLAAGWPYVQTNSVWSICTKTPLQIWLLFKVKVGKF